MRRILVTGASGFVGTHLLALLRERGFDATGVCLDNRREGLLRCDLRAPGEVDDLVRSVRPEGVVHLAGIAFVPRVDADFGAGLQANVLSVHNLLEALWRRCDGARVLLVSSAYVYGRVDARDMPITEDHPLASASLYGVTKAATEELGGLFERERGLDVVVARPFNHIGPGQDPSFVCSSFARQLVRIERGRIEPMIRVGDLETLRDFTDVRDVARAYCELLLTGRRGEAYNVCSGRELSIGEILARLVAASGIPKPRIETEPGRLRKGEASRFFGSPARIQADLGWRPEVPLEQSLIDTLDHWREEET